MADPTESFADLLDRGRRGDGAALARLVEQYEPRVRMVARVLLGPALRPYLDSVDLVQSVHHSLLLGLRQHKFDLAGPDNLIALAVTLVRRKVARQWRHLRRQQRLTHGGDAATRADLLQSLSSPRSDPAEAARFRDQVEHLCANLDRAERRILDLRLEGYSTAEIAHDLGINPVALRVRMTRLRQRLQASGVLDDWL
jgi:RNA polymerase sigma-70 factor (ECF subfamily)